MNFLINTYAAALHGVPVSFVSGDVGLTEEIQTVNENIVTFATKEGIGNATISVSPKLTLMETKRLVESSMKVPREHIQVPLPERFMIEIIYRDHTRAYRNSFYPNATFKPHNSVEFNTDDFL
ncbi:M55 family metallopeptidase [Lysinibacillus sp. MHQ-1]|nr:M55 family metallopeptidase [Lysinibacillus sp. MHQ-1]